MKPIPKFPPERSKEHLLHVRSLPCLICDKDSIPHHAKGAGMAIKGSDFLTVPLCWIHHAEVHQMGKKTFEKLYEVDLVNEARAIYNAKDV